MNYTVKELARLAGVTIRTLHYYDEIGLLRPTRYGRNNGYRYYDETALLRLQQILFFRELDFSLVQIKAMIDRADFDMLAALESHKRALLGRVKQINVLVETIDNTIKHIRGEEQMDNQDFYKGFDEAKQKEREKVARERWGDEKVNQSSKRWNSSSAEQKNAILAEGHEINSNIALNMDEPFDSPEVQYWIRRWHQSINVNFYDCSLEVFEALGHGYVEDPEFREFYEKLRPGMAAFMEKAMTHYCRVMAAQAEE